MHKMDASHILNCYTKEVRHKRVQFITFKNRKSYLWCYKSGYPWDEGMVLTGKHREDFWEAGKVLYLDLGGDLHECVHFIKTAKKFFSVICSLCSLLYIWYVYSKRTLKVKK